MKILLVAILIYLAVLFIFNFLIPLYITSRKLRKGFREMSARMNRPDGRNPTQEHMKQKEYNRQPAAADSPSPPANAGDYIDFEEVK